ncbi:hypothetical protein Tco_1305227 [Tanacetum coccineum]
MDYITSLYDEVQAKMDASKELAARLQMEERERERDVHNRRKILCLLGLRDDKMIDKMNKKAAGMDKEEVPESTKIVPVEEEEIDYEVMGMRVFKANGSSRYIKIFTEMVSRFDRLRTSMIPILAFEDGTEIHMLAERRYLLIRETLERMMELRLTIESKGEVFFDLLRFIQKQIDEFGDQDGSENDL